MKRMCLFVLIAMLAAMPLAAAKELRCSAVVADSTAAKGVLPSFSATKVLDVMVLLQFKHDDTKELAEGDHVAEVRFFGPQGYLYESRMVPLTGDTAKAGTQKTLPGYRRPVKKQLVKVSKSGKELEVGVPLPVGGTTIVSSSMYGKWRAEAYLDGSNAPCADPSFFTITQ